MMIFFTPGSKTCTSGFPEFPASLLGMDDGGNTDTAVTVLIPDMNFTCNTTIAGFTLAGINRRKRGQQDPVIQIWRENTSQHQIGIYHKIGPALSVNISDNDSGVCDDGLIWIASRTYWCILKKDFRVSVQPGDILGLGLPPTSDDDFDISFAEGGPMNYIFQQQMNSTTSVELSDLTSALAQLPQIIFSLISGIKGIATILYHTIILLYV